MALVTAVEALLPPASEEGRCQQCKRPFRGLRKQFAQFFSDDTAAGQTNKLLAEFYEARSSVSHGGRLFGWDGGVGGPTMRSGADDMALHMRLPHFVTLGVAKWLFRAKRYND